MSKWIFTGGFLLVLWLPIVQMVTGFSNQPILEENRKATPVPVFESWESIGQYAHQSVKWFDDSFGFRDFLIRLKTQADYSLFGMSTRVYVGRDGWLFYRSVIDEGEPNTEVLLRANSDAVLEGTRQLAIKLANRGIKLVLMIAPMKERYYGGFLDDSVSRIHVPRQTDLLQDRLKAMKEIVFIDSVSILKSVATQRNVFHKTDFHWNDPAAFEVSRVLVDELGRLEGKPLPVWKHALEIEEKPLSGGEALFMPIFYPPRETALFVKQTWVQPPYLYDDKTPPYEWVYQEKDLVGPELMPISILGDSFFDGMVRSGLWTNFRKVSRANWNKTTLSEVLENLPADTRYFLVEFIEIESRAYKALISEGGN